MKIANSIILATSILLLMSCNFIEKKFKGKKKKTDTTEVSTTTEDISTYEEAVTYEDAVDTTTQVSDDAVYTEEETTTETTTETTEIAEVTTPAGKYFIIGGSFKDYKNAERLIKKLAKEGCSSTQILDPIENFNRVVMFSFDDEESARTKLKELKKKDPAIWLLKAE